MFVSTGVLPASYYCVYQQFVVYSVISGIFYLQATSEIKPHLFPFLQPGAEGKLTNLYAEVSKIMNGIHNGDTEVEELVTIAQNWWVWL